jgi:F1F0 ATPase subunit 2
MTIDLDVIGVAAAWGGLLGAFFFGGLWWTLKRLAQRRHPRRFLGLSFLVRLLIVLYGFWLALAHGLSAFLTTLGAFALIRIVLTHRLGRVKGG